MFYLKIRKRWLKKLVIFLLSMALPTGWSFWLFITNGNIEEALYSFVFMCVLQAFVIYIEFKNHKYFTITAIVGIISLIILVILVLMTIKAIPKENFSFIFQVWATVTTAFCFVFWMKSTDTLLYSIKRKQWHQKTGEN